MKVTNGDIYRAKLVLREVANEKWPVKTAYWLARLTQKIGKAFEPIEAVRMQLVTEHSKETDDKGQAIIKAGTPEYTVFMAAFDELLDEEVELDVQKVILPETAGANIKAAALIDLDPFVEVA